MEIRKFGSRPEVVVCLLMLFGHNVTLSVKTFLDVARSRGGEKEVLCKLYKYIW